MRRLIWLIIVMAVSMSACQMKTDGIALGSGKSAGGNVNTYKLELVEDQANLAQLKMNLSQLGPMHARFVLKFEGSTSWIYQVDTRSDGTHNEYQLSVEGVEDNLDLGDVRLVNSFGHNFMSGPATGDVCFQFPDFFETEPLFLGPTEFIHLTELSSLPAESGRDSVLGRDAIQYSASTTSYKGWENVSVVFWIDAETEAVLKYEFSAEGNDPLYYKGDGKLQGLFEVMEIGPQQIAGIPNCVIDFPLPDDAEGLIRFPGLISFSTSMRPAKLDNFYTKALEPRGWTRGKPQTNPQTQDKVLEYTSQTGSIVIHLVPLNLQDFSEGYQVEIYFDE